MNKFLTIILGAVMALASCNAKQSSAVKEPIPDSENPDVIVKTLPEDLPSKDILKTILADYKGKVVVIDFWATWCGPCMNAMKMIDPIKDSYLEAKKPIAFVYITGETSPVEDYVPAIQTIKGYHYRLSNDQFDGLMDYMNISGIPTYYIADSKGRHSYDNIDQGGYPGDDVITSEIEKALNKK